MSVKQRRWSDCVNAQAALTCADPESFVREGSKFDNFFFFFFSSFFLVDEGLEDPNTAINGSSSARQRNAI